MNIPVRLGQRSYVIAVADSYEALPKRLQALGLPLSGWVISHHGLLERYGRELLEPLRQAGWSLETLIIPESERSKSLAVAARLVGGLARRATMRIPVLFAFGGGVVGDVTGFIAAVFRRGVPYIQLPTTLLAQVDSAIGGKVGVDLPEGKNLIGAFYQPQLVYNNTALLSTLPPRQRRSGLGEVIKYGVIADVELFSFLETHLKACLSLEKSAVRLIVERSCHIKAEVVSRDERETDDVRAHLNFGHTLGHALETATHYRRWTHGEAIAIGMCAAARLAVRAGFCRQEILDRVTHLIRASGLPVLAGNISPSSVLDAMRYDKKFIHGRPRWVLPVRIGKVVVTETLDERLVREVVAEYVKP